MADYINRQLVIDTFQRNAYDGWNQGISTTWANAFSECANMVEDIPPADVVEVVRCKNCLYWQDNNGGYPHEECRWGHDETPNEDDYCSYGERK